LPFQYPFIQSKNPDAKLICQMNTFHIISWKDNTSVWICPMSARNNNIFLQNLIEALFLDKSIYDPESLFWNHLIIEYFQISMVLIFTIFVKVSNIHSKSEKKLFDQKMMNHEFLGKWRSNKIAYTTEIIVQTIKECFVKCFRIVKPLDYISK
jgi:hypothetical protein